MCRSLVSVGSVTFSTLFGAVGAALRAIGPDLGPVRVNFGTVGTCRLMIRLARLSLLFDQLLVCAELLAIGLDRGVVARLLVSLELAVIRLACLLGFAQRLRVLVHGLSIRVQLGAIRVRCLLIGVDIRRAIARSGRRGRAVGMGRAQAHGTSKRASNHQRTKVIHVSDSLCRGGVCPRSIKPV
jgi:hypothetical protein